MFTEERIIGVYEHIIQSQVSGFVAREINKIDTKYMVEYPK